MVRAGYGVYDDTSVYQATALADGATVAALDEFERAEQRCLSADVRKRIQPMLLDYA